MNFIKHLLRFLPTIAAWAVVGISTTAVAQQPGEEETFHGEVLSSGQLQTSTSWSEARQAGHLLRVWRAATGTNGIFHVWAATESGPNILLGADSATNFAPIVVPFGTTRYMVLHTGTDSHIYYTFVNLDGSWLGFWAEIPGQTTSDAVGATQYDDRGFIYLVYRGGGADNHVWGTWYNPLELNPRNSWSQAEVIQNGSLTGSPSVTYAPDDNSLFVVVRGLNGDVWMSSQRVGDADWDTWTDLGPGTQTVASPRISATVTNVMETTLVRPDHRPGYALFLQDGRQVTDVTTDTTNWQTNDSVNLAPSGPVEYVLIRGLDGQGYWKQVYDQRSQ